MFTSNSSSSNTMSNSRLNLSPSIASRGNKPNGKFAMSSSYTPNRQAIALISEHGDPAADIGKEEAGGQNVYVRQVGETLAKLGWQVDMFTRKADANAPTIVQHSAHCRTIRLNAGPATFIPRDDLFEYMPEFVESLCQFQAQSGIHYPLVHTNYWMSAWVGLQLKQRSNVQLVHTYHSLGAVKYQSVSPLPAIADTRLAVERQILEEGDCVVATSPQEQAHLRQLVSQLGEIEVIPCGTNIQTFCLRPKTETRARLGFKADDQLVLYVGRFDQRKGIETLVRAMAQLKSQDQDTSRLRLVIVGGSDPNGTDGQERLRIGALVKELGLADCTEFVGQVGHDRLPDYYTAADVCVVPSHYEPFGLVAIEAMACGTPVVASDVGGLSYTVVPGQTGALVPPQDVDGFAAAIDRVLNQEQWSLFQRERLALRIQENFSWTGVSVQLSGLYRYLLANSLTHEAWSMRHRSLPPLPVPA